MPSSLTTLFDWLCGEFDNRPQALDHPIWFVHLRLWHRPLPMPLWGHLAFFAEQANALFLDQPYRQRIAVLQERETPENVQVQFWAFREPSRFKGAGAHPEKLADLKPDEDLEALPGCQLLVETRYNASSGEIDRFIATPPPDARCYFQYNGETRQVVLGFEVSENQFWSYDKGVDPTTGQALWGALMGPYEYQKMTHNSQS